MLGRGAGAEPKQHPAPPGPTRATCPLIQRPSRLWRSASRHKQTTKRAGRRTKTENRDQTPQQTGNRKTDESSRLSYYRPATAAQCNSWPKSPHLRRATLDSWRGGCLYLFVPFPSSIPVVACEYPGRASCPYLDYYSPLLFLVFRFSLLE